MINLTFAQAAEILTVQNLPTAGVFSGFSIDTRSLTPNNLFIAIPGNQADGHDYLALAQSKGAACALVNRKIASDLPQLLVPDTTLALGQLAAFWRNQFCLNVIAVTGSHGKTTLKTMLAAILVAACDGDEKQVLANVGNFNNHWGLPLTLARLNHQHRYAVLEMGMNHFGEIDYLSQLAHPDIAVITNAAATHIEGVGGTIAGVAKAKGEIFTGLHPQGIAILNRDDAFYEYWRSLLGQRQVLSFGFHPQAEITAKCATSSTSAQIKTPQGSFTLNLPLLGKHNILNALAATATMVAINIPLTAIKQGLESVKPVPGRLQVHTLENGVNIIDDTYNASPFSVLAALEALASFKGKKILVLGDMKELGGEAKNIHYATGEQIRKAQVDHLFTYGELSQQCAEAFGSGALHFTEQTSLIKALQTFLSPATTILVKGSRSMHMEKVVAGLMQAEFRGAIHEH